MLLGNWYTHQGSNPDWCGMKSFRSSDERHKNVVQQEQVSDVLHTRAETGEQNLNFFIKSKHNRCIYLWLHVSCQRKSAYSYLFMPDTSPPVTKRINKFWRAVKKECNWNRSISIQKLGKKKKKRKVYVLATATLIHLRNSDS